MKCPKCGYISFDYNQVCPKCDKDLAHEREKMNLPSYKPNPPSLLNDLVGEEEGQNGGAKISSQDLTTVIEPGAGMTPEDSKAIEAMEEAFKEGENFEIQLESEVEKWEPPEAVEISDLAPETPELETQEEAPISTAPPEDGLEELSRTVMELQSEDIGETPAQDLPEDETAFLDLDDLSKKAAEAEAGEVPDLREKEESAVDLEELASLVEDLKEEDEGQEVETSPGPAEKKDDKTGEHPERDKGFSEDLDFLDLDLELEEPEDKSS